ncbi:Abnormal spindle-like microcephaly-associated protein -like protein [Triplophysa tibetana]|uniref:Abnormal spindle-like microcephaly-associated protein-like protein n=1 Tax=Triplophysa tibetana TaxID=1572043 RepID=A0A5A9NQ75_9TELE|nr:Abnormal spindle-like microcephaly-associated protein -like protein [Triplophysa tibetana]
MSLKSAKAECLDFSPTFDSHRSRDKGGKENNNSIPVLSLVQFSRSPFVSFGTIKLGSSKSQLLRIENPTEDVPTTVVVDKISSTKGFSVDRTSFTIQPEDSIILNVTWTPVEEGGVRELLSFVANGIVKHQAILLGKAETTKKKKRTLWDSIKSKRGVPAPSNENKLPSVSIKASNKTFHVSRQSQYNKERTSNPLSPLNQERFVNGSSVVRGNAQSSPPRISKPAFVTEVFDDVHLEKNSPVVVLIPADRFVATPDKTDATCLRKAECKEVVRVLDKTLSPFSTSERFRNPLSSCFQSPLPVIGKLDEGQEQEKLSLSVKHALGVIGSDLSCAVSPPNACSSYDFSDSLESEKQDRDGTFIATVDISPPPEAPHPRLTYCVKPNKTIGVASNHDEVRLEMFPFSTASVTKLNKVDDTLNPDVLGSKVPVNSTTVTKSKAESSVESPGMRKKKTSRRRLLERTLEISESSNAESNTSSPESISALPIISSDSSPDVVISEKTTPCLSLPSEQPLSCISPIRSEVLASVSSSRSTSLDEVPNDEPSRVSPNLFPVQSRTSVQSKKRKSDEFLRDHLEDVSNFNAKKCRAPTRAQGAKKPSQEKTFILKSTSGQPQQRKPADGQSLKSLSTSTRKSAKIVAVAQAKLTFMNPTQTVIPRHPLPFAAKNMFYDERWIEKQERGFSWWMNYVLTPDDFKVATEVTKVNALSLTLGNEKFNIPKAPTKEEMSFRTYTARQRLNRLRRAACRLFTSDAMVKAIQRLELEVEAKRLLVRKDRHLWKDIGERQKVLNWLLSYNPLWLRIGFETIFGELIPLESNSDVVGLAMFILGRLLWNPDIAAEYRHGKVPNLYRDGHEEALSRFSLKKLILLVCFLDKAKESRLIDHDPCLFCMDAEFKSSKDLLLAFARDFLSGEGILSRHLGHLGLAVSHVQTPLDEFNFAVKNLAVDLRCGIRLVRVMELFTLDWTLSRKLRIPAISRLQKVHNVEIVLQVLKDKGVDLRDEHGATIDSRDVVDGHREKTLNLLWKIIFVFQVEVMLDENQLKEEISFLRKTWRTKQKLASLIANKGAVVTKRKTRQAFEHPSQKVTLLLDWVNAVCEFYSLKAENFTVSFSDGRVLCYLIHHYHPGHLPAESIQHKTTQTIECGHRGKVELNISTSDSDCSFDTYPSMQDSPSVDFKELLENEKSNFQLVNTAVSNLGGVPAMINPEDMSNTIPNEKVVTCYLSFLCARLLDLRNETRAARVIQDTWRRYKLQKDIELNRVRVLFFNVTLMRTLLDYFLHRICLYVQQKNLAAAKIQALVRRFILKRRLIRQNKAAMVIQMSWRGHAARETFRMLKQEQLLAFQNAAAAVIQKTYKAWRDRALLRKNHAASLIQGAFRKWHVKKVTERNNAAIRIQSWYRMQRCKKQYMEMKMKAICIQAMLRGHHQRLKFQTLKKRNHASVIIQSAFRAYLVRRQIFKMEQNAVLIQRWFRACVLRKAVRKRYLKIKSAVITLQAAFCGWKVRRELAQRCKAALQIQTAFRRFSAVKSFRCLKRSVILLQQRYRANVLGNKLRLEYDALKVASVTIQAAWRGRTVRRKMHHLHRCAEIIQSHYRRYVVQTRFMKLKRAAVVIQRQYRAFREGKKAYGEYMEMKRAAVVLQSAYRGRKARKEIQLQTQAAILIQSSVRGYNCRRAFLAQKCSAVVIQQRYRAFALGQSQRVCYLQLRQSTITLQAIYRGSKIRRQLRREQQAATIIQAQFRMHKVRISFLAAKYAAIIIQQRYRAYKTGKSVQDSYSQMKDATVVIQAAFRGMKVRNSLRKSHQAATVIQAHFRGHLQRKKFQKQQWAVSVLRERYRAKVLGNKLRLEYDALKVASVTIQAAWRGRTVRRKMHNLHRCAEIIQSHYRRFVVQTQFMKLKQAAVVIQRQYRAFREGKKAYGEYMEMKRAAVVLQSAYRGRKARKEIQLQTQAAILIQSSVRGYNCRCAFLAKKFCAVVIQQRYRAFALGQSQRICYLQLRQSTITLQAIYRGSKIRRQLRREQQAATIIQARFRMHKVRISFLAAKYAAIIIQQRYRAYKTGKYVQDSYSQMKNATVVIQSAFRGMKVRNRLRKSHQAATVIQAHFRGHLQRKKFQKQLWAASVLRERFKATVVRNDAVKKYAAMKRAALCIQSAFRGMKIRKQIAECHKSAVIVQKTYKAYKQRCDYVSLRNATLLVQQQYRAILSAKQQRNSYCALRTAAITLQSAYRGMRIRKEIRKRHESATVIQAWLRMYRTRVTFQAMRLAALVIQRQYRCHLLRKEARVNFLRLRSSATTIQAIYRGNRTRRNITTMHHSATIIQRRFLAYKTRKCFLSIRAAVVVCQLYYRSALAARSDRRDYLAKCQAVLKIQAGFRGMQVRRQINREHVAAVLIQSHVRKRNVKLCFQRLQRAVETVQRRFRAIQMVRHEMAVLKEKKNAALILQSAYRGMKSRQTFKRMHDAATVIQTAFRACSARKRYLTMKYAAIAIQQRYRAGHAAKMQRMRFIKIRQGAIALQACFRGRKARRTLLFQHHAAVLIQSYFRRHKEMVKFQAMRLSANIIQSHYRSHIRTKADREKFLRLRKSAVVIQAAFRGHSVRRQLAEMQRASIILQAAFRMHQKRSAFRRQIWAARVLQRRFRALKLRDEQMQRYQQVRNATICLQKSFRALKEKQLVKRTNAARTIQSYLRMSLQQKRFLKEKAAAIVIQSAYKGYRTRVWHTKIQESTAFIQKWYRSRKLVNKERNDFLVVRQATLKLQSALRGMLARRLARRIKAAIKIQSVFRMHVYRRRYVSLRSSVVKIQAHYRMLVAQRRYRTLQASAVTLQMRYRAQRAKTKQRCSYLKTIQSINILQARIRGHIEYRRFHRKRTSAITIQAHYRGMLERRMFQRLKQSICVLQKHYRAFRLCQKERARFHQLRQSAVVIQRAFRAYQTRQHAVKEHAACKIQAWYRGGLARRSYILKRAAITTIQRCIQARRQRSRFQVIQRSVRIIQQRWRETVEARKQRSDFLRFRKSVIFIQALWRGVRVRKSIQMQIKAAVKIQSAFRGFTQRREYKLQRAAAAILQQRFRALQLARAERENLRIRHDAAIKEKASALRLHRFTAAVFHQLCAIRIQRAVRAHWALVSAKRQMSVVLYIQQCFRAKLQRKKYLKYRQDIIKTQRAVRTWLNRRNQAATTIQHAVKRFLLSRRKERMQHGITKAQYHRTIDAVYSVENSVETLLDLLQIYREKAGDKVGDKGGSIFTKACFLLVLLVQDERRAMEVRNLPKASDRIRSICRLTLRKCKMDSERTKVKQKMNASLNGSFLLQATPRKSKPVARFVPDWVLRRDKMKDIVDPLRAIQMLASALALAP